MEKRSIGLRSIFFIISAALVSICMLMNWFPVELDLGIVQFDDVFGTVNAFTLSGTVSKIEDTLGNLAGFLPEEFEMLKIKSAVLMVCAYATIASYICASAMHIVKKNIATDLASLGSAVLAIITSVAFSNLVKGVCTFTASSAAGNAAYDIVMQSPCVAVLFGGILSAICTEMVANWIGEQVVGVVGSIAATMLKIINIFVELIMAIAGNIGFVLSDCAGAFLGILVGAKFMEMTASLWLSVVVGLGVAGLAAGACMVVIDRVIYRER